MLFKSTGILTYSPKTHLRESDRWLILQCDDDICKYYAALFRRETPWLPKLARPVWGAHISVIRGEKIQNPHLWGKGNKVPINFEWEPGVCDNGEYYWLKVKCDALLDIREAFGLSREPRFGLHLTVGRTTDESLQGKR